MSDVQREEAKTRTRKRLTGVDTPRITTEIAKPAMSPGHVATER